jgi:hypothetical protein
MLSSFDLAQLTDVEVAALERFADRLAAQDAQEHGG